MKLYQVTARYSETLPDGWRTSVGVPTFYLRDDIQMIPDREAAEGVARHMLSGLRPGVEWEIGIAESKEFDPGVIGA